MKNPAEAGFGADRNVSVGAVKKPVSDGCPEAQIAYRGVFLPAFGKSGKKHFRGRSSLAGVQQEFDHSCAMDPDKRCKTALSLMARRSRKASCPSIHDTGVFRLAGADDAQTWQSANALFYLRFKAREIASPSALT
ncbi:hypothetical protein [Pseudomonas syringae]|uniref:hypothetical protein n=1 Tax=Pseudomonas syringae TaxID=317 RepID=UPI0013044FBE|nr:hypothetical protein [Pseudomonas syringae]